MNISALNAVGLDMRGYKMSRYTDVDVLKEWVENWLYKDRYYHNGRVSKAIPTTELYDILEQIPTADVVEVKHGKWMFTPCHSEGICTNCNYKIYGRPYQNTYLIVPYNFCPNCGAKMDKEKREDEQIH